MLHRKVDWAFDVSWRFFPDICLNFCCLFPWLTGRKMNVCFEPLSASKHSIEDDERGGNEASFAVVSISDLHSCKVL